MRVWTAQPDPNRQKAPEFGPSRAGFKAHPTQLQPRGKHEPEKKSTARNRPGPHMMNRMNRPEYMCVEVEDEPALILIEDIIVLSTVGFLLINARSF